MIKESENSLMENIMGDDATTPEEISETVNTDSEENSETEVVKDTEKEENVEEKEQGENKDEPNEEEYDSPEIEVKEIDPVLLEIAKDIDPEAEYTDTGSVAKTIKAKMEETKAALDTLQSQNKEIFDTFNDIPSLGDFMSAVLRKIPPKVAAAIYISEDLAPEEGDRDYPEYEEELEKIAERKKQAQKAVVEMEKNNKESVKRTDEFIEKNKLEKDSYFKAVNEFDSMLTDLKKGIVSEELMTAILRYSQWDKMVKIQEKAIKDAEEKAYLKGRNEKIKLVRSQKENTDGLPGITSGSDKSKSKPESNDIFDQMLNHRR